ncbi:MAG TPA: hypothetical protein VMT01_03585 [Candidatus Acidoferrum sp.]|nr:hypothetical protein [Candidatus Acidoferrum sp.]
MFGIVEIVVLILMFIIGPLAFGLLLGLIRERVIGLCVLLLVYVLLVVLWQGDGGTPSGPVTIQKASWFFGFYLLPALVGYMVGYILSKKGKLPMLRLLRRKNG